MRRVKLSECGDECVRVGRLCILYKNENHISQCVHEMTLSTNNNNKNWQSNDLNGDDIQRTKLAIPCSVYTKL